MNPRLQRALLLIDQGRQNQAEGELRQALSQEPNDSVAHAALALCLADRQQYDQASEEAAAAIHLAPDDSFGFYSQAIVFAKRNWFAEAEEAVRQAIALAPDRADHFSLLGQILLDRSRWQPALDAAEQGLKVDAQNVNCQNVRARALVQLRRKGDAQDAISASLARDPENALTHANMGWTLIERGQYEKALEHFREALRLEPQLEWARAGIIEALKARRLFYRILLRYFLWTQKLSGRGRWAIILGAYIGYQVLRGVARNNPQLAPYIFPILALYIGWAVSTWMVSPLFNLSLLLDRFGRLALSREEKITGAWVGLCLLGAIAGAVAWLATDVTALGLAALVSGLLIPPISRIHSCDSGWPRTVMVLITVGLALVGTGGVACHLVVDDPQSTAEKVIYLLGGLLLLVFLVGAFASQLAANALVGVRPRR